MSSTVALNKEPICCALGRTETPTSLLFQKKIAELHTRQALKRDRHGFDLGAGATMGRIMTQSGIVLTRTEERILILILAWVQCTHILDFVIMMPLGPQFMRIFEISPPQFGLLVSAYTFSAAGSGLLCAGVVDRFDRKKVLLVLYFGFVLGTLLCAIATNYQMLMLARIFAGAFGGVLSATVFAVLGDGIPIERRGVATGIVMSAFSLASVIGVPIGLFLATRFDWHTPFSALAGLGVVVLALIGFGMPSMRGHVVPGQTPQAFLKIIELLREPIHWKAFAMTASLMLAGFTVIPFMSPAMVANFKVAEADLQYVYLVGGLFTFFTSRWIGKLCDRFGYIQIFTPVALLSLAPILLVTHLGSVPFAGAIAISSLFMVLVSGRFVPSMALLNAVVVPKNRGAFMNLNSSVQSLFSGIASLIAGKMITQSPGGELLGYPAVGYLACSATLLTIVLGFRLSRARE